MNTLDNALMHALEVSFFTEGGRTKRNPSLIEASKIIEIHSIELNFLFIIRDLHFEFILRLFIIFNFIIVTKNMMTRTRIQFLWQEEVKVLFSGQIDKGISFYELVCCERMLQQEIFKYNMIREIYERK